MVQLVDVTDKNPSYDEFDNELLYTDLRERIRYLTQFLNFTEHDVEALNEFQPILLPIVDQLVETVYSHLFRFDVTKKVFMPRKDGQEGRMLSDLHDLALDAPQIEIRKRTFGVYLRKLVTCDYDDFTTWQYFDHVGLMHCGRNELKHRKLMGKAPLYVDLMHLSLLLGWTMDVLTPIILTHDDTPLMRRIDILRAFQKVIWIQNDLFARHYAVRSTEVAGLKTLRQAINLSSSDDVQSELLSINALNTTSTFSSTTTSTASSPSPKGSPPPVPSPTTKLNFSVDQGARHVASQSRDLKDKKSWFSFGR
ncbi:hypothetical protein FA15DRAFT_595478 [Coprinopsis marcescibilis]|uniref:Globin-sensor domain-containing protein n=1 Tax=Coprinopsis marcescibilis TaxID=230819 RepID=A0A5C3KSH7_COPMA|nr:hypothetical protein FA15DRAFT_595478 [Coprinopsis marcescibilis]